MRVRTGRFIKRVTRRSRMSVRKREWLAAWPNAVYDSPGRVQHPDRVVHRSPFSSCSALRCIFLVRREAATTTSDETTSHSTRLAKDASYADFCPVTAKIPSRRAMVLPCLLPVRSLAAGSLPQRLGLGDPVSPFLELRFSSTRQS